MRLMIPTNVKPITCCHCDRDLLLEITDYNDKDTDTVCPQCNVDMFIETEIVYKSVPF